MSRNVAAPAPSVCPEDLLAALSRRGGGAERDRLLLHVEQCTRCLARIAEGVRPPTRSHDEDEDEPVRFISIGDVIGNGYRVEELIGSGAMGSVYRAKQLSTNIDVALKILRPERLADVNAERRFSREARATASLRSPYAIRTFEIDRLPNGIPFIAMEYLRGADLGALLLEHTTLPMADAVRYIIEACDAVGEAHDRSIIHRDIKPANLFLTRDGTIKVLDFGLAKNLPIEVPEAGSEATKTNFLLGSPHYMSPEQLRSAREVDPRADIWSLGATLYHLVAGSPPFSGMNLYVLIGAIMNDGAPSLTSRLPEAPLSLDAVVARCLRRDRENRYPTCAALADALREVHELLAHPADASEPTRQLAPPPDLHLERRRAAMTLDASQVDDALLALPPARPPRVHARTLQSPQAPEIVSFADPEDDVDPTLLGGAPQFVVEDDADATSALPPTLDAKEPTSDLPKLYEDDPSSDPKENHVTMLMSETVDRLLSTVPARAVLPRVYDDDIDLLPDVTKVMTGSAPYLQSASPLPAAGRLWNQTVPLAQPMPAQVAAVVAAAQAAQQQQSPPVALPEMPAPRSYIRLVLLMLIILLIGVAVFTFTVGAMR